MTLSAWQEQAKDGDAAAIAALLNQSLKAQNLEVRAERDSYCLSLWISGATLPPQPQLMDYLRRAIERLQLDCIGILHIEAEATTDASQNWTAEMTMLAGLVQAETGGVGRRIEEAESRDKALGKGDTLASEAAAHGVSGGGARSPQEARADGLGTGQPAVDALPPKVARAYRELGLSPDATLADIDRAYFKTKAALLRQGKRDELEPLKWAFSTLKDYLENPPQPDPPSPAQPATPEDDKDTLAPFAGLPPLGYGSPPPPAEHRHGIAAHPSPAPWPPAAETSSDAAQVIQTLLHERGLPAHVVVKSDQLHLRWPAVRVVNSQQATAQIYSLLLQQDLVALGLGDVKTLVVAALNRQNQVVWRQTLTMPQRPTEEEDSDLMSFNNRYSNGIFFPALLAIGMILNAMPIFNSLLWGIKIWIHEFGHAVVAWLAGRQAIPLPIGWTNVNPERSFFVYVGILILLGLLFWAGQKEGKRWPMVLAVSLAIVQFVMTWLMSPNTFDMLLAFGGIGGELYLSTLLMVSFFFPMPTYWRWDFYRYPVVLGAAFTFWGQFWLWKSIRWGQGSIPFGAMWSDAEHGDMNILVNRHSWEPGDLISTYNTVANLCFLALFGVYAYVLYRQHRHWIWMMRQRWLG